MIANNGALASAGRRLSEFSTTIDTERALRQQAEARAQAEADAKSECLARLEEALRQLVSVEDEAASKARAVIAEYRMRNAAAVTIQHGFHRMRSRRDYRAWLAAHQYKLGQFAEVTRTAAATAAAKGSNVTVATQTIPPPRTPMATARRLDGPSKRNVTDAVAARSGAVRAALAAGASTGHEDYYIRSCAWPRVCKRTINVVCKLKLSWKITLLGILQKPSYIDK
eukprot:COSAG01_NODE_3209_length_6417_cov_3.078189_4_plen_226_part_00